MFCIRMADLTIRICNRYQYVRRLCKDYTIPDVESPDLIVEVTEEEILEEISISEVQATPAYAEGVCVYRNICKRLPLLFNAFLMHCAVIEYKGKGYAFAAQSGTGKSTHISLWQKHFGEEVRTSWCN